MESARNHSFLCRDFFSSSFFCIEKLEIKKILQKLARVVDFFWGVEKAVLNYQIFQKHSDCTTR